ncbi:alpha-glucosidase [Wenyingzhuangia heitensis]|uniref:Alpha-glucosidase n=1 Tax=Wenyingzhuangia heitensis TaxID=1487859 RepID=A0ABX0U8C4_9FLAO|nr:glycoside hydrolase family 97 protein [Wenyingzhuangia heitensis]NIJ45090.1 alpha-glucosidase [Wenyingzhuangia heitensis]
MNKGLQIVFFIFLWSSLTNYAQQKVVSPDKNIEVNIELSEVIVFSIAYNNQYLVDKGIISLELLKEVLGKQPKLLRTETATVNAFVNPVISLKNKEIVNHYNSLHLFFENDYQLEFRVFNNGVGYRFITTKDQNITVVNEQAEFQLSDNYKSYISKTEKTYSNYEHAYDPVWLQDFNTSEIATLPAFVDAQESKMLIAEADLYDYPAMFIQGTKGNSVSGWFPKYPTKIKPGKRVDRRLDIVEEGNFIAKTSGNRSFPWRIFAIAKEDKNIVTNDLVYLLSRNSTYKNFDWIKPGQTSWEWWHASNIIGVDFKAGYNTETYKYYIDFASHYGMEYTLMDEGWSYSVLDITKPNPDIDLEELIRYAKEKNVSIILWASWLAVENTPTFFDYAKSLGVAGIKIDFMDRSDQWMMNFYERTAKKAFEKELLVDFHGSISPRGLRKAYPNVISYEGVTGMEQNKGGGFDTPNNHVILPFTRNVVGPMDYTPGSMKSVHPEYWHANWTNPMSIGTRGHQLALFVVFESGLQMLADNPSDYYKEDECTRFITDVPTTWDETIVISGKIGEHIVVAKRKGKDWYVGGITNDEGRKISIDFSFLEKGNKYEMDLFVDGVNADSYAIDYKRESKSITSKSKEVITMTLNGGFAAKLTIK